VLFALGVAIIAAFSADRMWIRGNGIVAGELTAIAPIMQARLENLFVKCLDHVVRGQRLAEFDNEALVEAAAQQLHQLQFQLTQARAQIDIAEQAAQAARKVIDAQRALYDQLVAVRKSQDELRKNQYVAELVWEKANADVVRAEAETQAAEFVYETKMADKKQAELAAEALQNRIDDFNHSPELTGHFYLNAPKDGIVTECVARPGEVVAAKAPIFSIFNPDDTYAVVFFNQGDIAKLDRGQSFEISIYGIDKPVTGTVTDFYPELSALPSSLTRYFWQQEKWSQYIPVRLDFTNLNATQRSKLFAWAQLSASRSPDWGLPDVTAAASVSWQWVQQHLDGTLPLAAASLAQRPIDR
jgi:HlyD family secretion protein